MSGRSLAMTEILWLSDSIPTTSSPQVMLNLPRTVRRFNLSGHWMLQVVLDV